MPLGFKLSADYVISFPCSNSLVRNAHSHTWGLQSLFTLQTKADIGLRAEGRKEERLLGDSRDTTGLSPPKKGRPPNTFERECMCVCAANWPLKLRASAFSKRPWPGIVSGPKWSRKLMNIWSLFLSKGPHQENNKPTCAAHTFFTSAVTKWGPPWALNAHDWTFDYLFQCKDFFVWFGTRLHFFFQKAHKWMRLTSLKLLLYNVDHVFQGCCCCC